MLPMLRLPKPFEARALGRMASRVLDVLYPTSCAVCQTTLTHGRTLCDACDADLPRIVDPFCGRCGEAFDGKIEGAFTCPNCSQLRFAFSFARPAMLRDDRTLEMIHRLKYGREIHLAGDLGRLAAEAFSDERLGRVLEEKWPLIPVPLHRSRQRWRHFNQAEEIGRSLSARTGLPLLHGLRRIRSTETQTRLTRAQRLANLKGAFVPTRPCQQWVEGAPAGALLVDDVLTTGSTVDECARTLRQVGFREIVVVTVMRG